MKHFGVQRFIPTPHESASPEAPRNLKIENRKKRRRERINLLRELFFGRDDAYAKWQGDQPVAVRQPLSNKVLAAHLAGEYRVGSYVMSETSRTRVLVFDVDVPNRKLVRKLVARLKKWNIEPHVERSKSKGFHVWLFLDNPLRAAVVRKFAKLILSGRLANPRIEVFPKQDKVAKGGLGNCIWLPLFGKDTPHERTVFLDHNFEPLSKQWAFLKKHVPTPRQTIIEAVQSIKEEKSQRGPAGVVAPSGGPILQGERNKSLTSLAGAMRHRGSTEGGILAALTKENQQRCRPPLADREVAAIATSVSRYAPAENSGERGRKNQTTRLVELASDVRFFHTADGEAFGSFKVADHLETRRLRDIAFKRWLAARYYKQFGKAPSSYSVQDALGALEGIALYGGKRRKVFTRIARRKAAIYVDLCDERWRVIRIDKQGWKVLTNSRVKFRRTRGMKPLLPPVHGGSIDELRQFLNVGSDSDFVLVVSWLVAALNPRGPYPALVLLGEAGSAKSTTERVLRALVDPNIAPLRSGPREVRDLMIAAQNAWVVAFDNVSSLPPWLSDALCQLATGGGFATRQLYTDDEEKLIEAMRPMLLNGIDAVVTRGDLMDRSVIIYLPTIADSNRRSEKEFWHLFYEARSRILGALLDGVAVALRRLRKVELDRHPRMADFARWATAAEPAFGWDRGTFMAAYDANRASANVLTLEASPLVAPLKRLLGSSSEWRGTAAELLYRLAKLAANDDPQQRTWPKNGQGLSTQLRRIAPNLRPVGIDVQLGEKTAGSGSKRIITIRRQKKPKSYAAD